LDPVVAYNSQDDEYLMAWAEPAWPRQQVWLRRLRAGDAAVLNTMTVPGGPNDVRSTPQLAYDAARNDYLVTYLLEQGPDVRAVLAPADLSALGAEIHVYDHAPSVIWVTHLAAAAGANDFLVAWGMQTDTSGASLYGRLVSGGGTPQGAAGGFLMAAKTPAFPWRGHPRAAYVPRYGYLTMMEYQTQTMAESHVYGRYVMSGADSAAGSAFALDDTAGTNELEPAIACAPDGRCLVVATFREATPGADAIIRGRMVDLSHLYLPATVKNAD
jgi:hypothetical protein